jgi:hypothetical protein
MTKGITEARRNDVASDKALNPHQTRSRKSEEGGKVIQEGKDEGVKHQNTTLKGEGTNSVLPSRAPAIHLVNGRIENFLLSKPRAHQHTQMLVAIHLL